MWTTPAATEMRFGFEVRPPRRPFLLALLSNTVLID
jgi:coenzyme PQQ precursor peptide PqqA